MKISIITPNYNYSKFLPSLLDSVLYQSYDNWEHIIVDDGSTDNSTKIIDGYVKRYPEKIKLICQNNAGQSSALNRALKEVSGDIIGWINSDDLYHQNTFTIVTDFFKKNPKYDAVFGNLSIIDEQGKITSQKKYLEFNYVSGCILGFGNMIANNTLFIKKETFDNIGGFNEQLSYIMDVDLYFRLGKVSKIKKLNHYLASFRRHSESKSIKQEHMFSQEEKELKFRSYQSLTISKYISFRYISILRLIFRMKRIFLKIIHG